MNFQPNDVMRRSRAAALILAGLFTWLAAGFFRTQILEHERYARTSEQNRLRPIPLPAARGQILDRHGLVIAETVPGYLISIRAQSEDSLKATLGRLAPSLALTPADIESAVKRHKQDKTRPTSIRADASFELVSILMEHQSDYPGLIIQSAPKRFYPFGRAVAALVGYTGEISEGDLAKDKYKERYKAGQEIGKAGLELMYEDSIRGREGTQFVEVDAFDNIVRGAGALQTIRPVAGPALHTNIDLDLQRFIADSIFPGDSTKAGLIAMDPRNGEVLALFSAPTYDANQFIGRISNEEYRLLRTNPGLPLLNRVSSGLYPPASTFKLATAVIALQNGLVGLDERMPISCTGGFQLGNRRFGCWEKSGHGDVTLAQAIEHSCDVYFYQLGLRVTLQRLLADGGKLGFTQSSGIDLPGEVRPIFPEGEQYYTKRWGTNWSRQATTLNLSIGQGENSQTVPNMARFYSALATGGIAPVPHIAKQPADTARVFRLSESQMSGLLKALAGVVAPGGTAASARIEGIVLAGKTGTAQKSKPNPDDAWFVGFAPADNPTILVAVVIEGGLHGYVAARVAKRIIERYLKARTPDMKFVEG